MKKKYKRPRNLNELSYALSEVFADTPNKELDKSDAKVMVAAASGIINVAKIYAVQNEAAVKGGQINLMEIEFGKYPETKKGLSIAEAAAK